jgi:hypothetical protein
MKSKVQIALAAMLVALASLSPAYASTGHKSSAGHSHAQTYHDRTPKAHVHDTRAAKSR